jgi:hypothetical protein
MSSASMSPALKPFSKQLETVVTAFAQMAVVCTFGLAVTIGAAGLAHTKLPLLCPDCASPVAIATSPLRA